MRTALVNATTDLPKGNLEGKRQEFTLDTNDQLFDASAFRNIIAAYRNGAPVQIKDIGDVINSSQSARTGAWFDGKRIELLLIEREPGANTIKVVDEIKAMMPALEASIPRSVHVDLVSDRSTNIRDSVADVELTLIDHYQSRGADDLPVPAQGLGDDHPQRDGAAGAWSLPPA